YTKTVVAATVNAQKYNPELTWTQRTPDPRIAQLSDKLRHIRQVVLSQLTLAPESDSYIRDEEGSGSGHSPVTQWNEDDEQDPNWPDEGSASGEPEEPDSPRQEEFPKKPAPDTDGIKPPSTGTTGVATRSGVRSCAVAMVAVLIGRISLV
ncbi:hypothetical protein L9F63_014298, partial [Diploptera punctata]